MAPQIRVIAPDFLGHGYSDRRDFFDRSLLAQTAMILRLMDHLEIERAHFVGHDTGGGVSLIMAIEHAERVGRLVLTNAVAYDSWPIDDMIALGNPSWRGRTPDEVADFLASGLPDGIYNDERLTPEFINGIVAPYRDEEGKISIIRNASALNTNHTTMLVERHGQIKASTLCLWGVHDPWQTIGDGERLAIEIPSARLVGVENVLRAKAIVREKVVVVRNDRFFFGSFVDAIGLPIGSDFGAASFCPYRFSCPSAYRLSIGRFVIRRFQSVAVGGCVPSAAVRRCRVALSGDCANVVIVIVIAISRTKV